MSPAQQQQQRDAALPPPSEFALIPGAVAWARRGRPTCGSGGSGASTAAVAEARLAAPVSSSDDLWWPCILYPSWGYAAKESGLMGLGDGAVSSGISSDDGDGSGSGGGSGSSSTAATHAVRIAGCRKPVAVKFLRKNMVPERAALRPRVVGAKPGKQTKVVAHFLGLDPHTATGDSVAAWGPVEMTALRPYRRDAYDVLKSYRGRVARSDWTDLLRAVDEASEALEDWSVTSKELLLNIPEEEEAGDAHGAAVDDAGRGQTPEYYDDWKGGSESQSQRNTQFSQVHFSQAQFSHGGQLSASEMDEKKDAEADANNSTSPQQRDATTTNTSATPFPGAKVTKVTPSPHTANSAVVAEPTKEVAEGNDGEAKRLFPEASSGDIFVSQAVSKKRPTHTSLDMLEIPDEKKRLKTDISEQDVVNKSEEDQAEVAGANVKGENLDGERKMTPMQSQDDHNDGDQHIAEEEQCQSLFTQAFVS